MAGTVSVNKSFPDKLETAYMTLWIDDGILHCKFCDSLDMDLDIAKNCVGERVTFSNFTSYPCLIDMKGLVSVTKEAREYMAADGSLFITAGALLVNNSLTKMLGNLFLNINKPKVPTRIFTEEEEAKKWLKQFL